MKQIPELQRLQRLARECETPQDFLDRAAGSDMVFAYSACREQFGLTHGELYEIVELWKESYKAAKEVNRPMLSKENKRILDSACAGICEAKRSLIRGRAHTASQCCREAEGRIGYVISREEVDIIEVNDYVKECMAR